MKEFAHKKSLGQHFLNSPLVPAWMCDAADIQEGDTVVEIGPGTGILTAELLKRGAKVIALEADQRAVDVIDKKFSAEINKKQLRIEHCDARDWNPQVFHLKNQSFKVVSNIPYYLSGLLFRIFLSHQIQPNCLVFLVQKEVAKRITSNLKTDHKESLLSLSAQIYGQPKYVQTVPRGHFTPPPKVDSGIVLIRNISRDKLENLDEQLFFNVLHLGFGQKRKQLLGNLSAEFDRQLITDIFSKQNLPLNIRAEDMPLEKWVELVKLLQENT